MLNVGLITRTYEVSRRHLYDWGIYQQPVNTWIMVGHSVLTFNDHYYIVYKYQYCFTHLT